jgi:hypothetical protein
LQPKRKVWTLFLPLFLALTICSPAQSHRAVPPDDPTEKASDPDEMRERQAHDMAKKANIERQAALKTDTEKLLKLATELKDYVDKTDEHVLSLEVIKKADEIDKLAKSVKEKMRGAN